MTTKDQPVTRLEDRIALAREAIEVNIRANRECEKATAHPYDAWSGGVVAGLQIALRLIDAATEKKPS